MLTTRAAPGGALDRLGGALLRHRLRRTLQRRTSVTAVVAVGPRQQRDLAGLPGLPGLTDALVVRGRARALGGRRRRRPLPTGNAGIRVTRLPVAATANDARNAGTAAATTTSVIFLDATDTLRRSAVAELVDALATGVDVVAGRGHRLAERLWRRSAVPRFDPEHGRFPWGALPDSQVLGRTVSDGAPVWATPFGTVPPVSAELVAFSGALEASVRKPWLAALLTAETPVFLDDLEHAGEAEVARFAAVAGAALDAVGQDGLLDVPFETRARLWLVANGRAAEMSRMTSARWFSAGQAPTRVVDGRLLAVLDDVDVPDDLLQIRPVAEASLQRAVTADGRLHLTLFAAIRWLDFAAHPPRLAAAMVHESGDRVVLPVEPGRDPAVTRWTRQAHQNHDTGLLEVIIDPVALTRGGRWTLEVAVAAGGFSATARVVTRESRGSAALLDACGPHLATFDAEHGVQVVVGERPASRPPPVTGPQVERVDAGERLELSGTAPGPFSLALAHGDLRVPGEVVVADGRFRATLPLDHDPWGFGPAPLSPGTWHLDMVGRPRRRPAADPRRARRGHPARPPHGFVAGPRPARPARPAPGPARTAAGRRRAGTLGPAPAAGGVRRLDGPARPRTGALLVVRRVRGHRQSARDLRGAAAPSPGDAGAVGSRPRRDPGARGCREGAGAQPGLVCRTGVGRPGRDQRRDGPVLPAPPGSATGADVPRLPLEVHGTRPVAFQELLPDAAGDPARQHDAHLVGGAHADPGDGPSLSRAVLL